MPSYVITAPDGSKHKVTGEGTEEQALAAFQSQYSQQPQQPKKRRSYLDVVNELGITGAGHVDAARGMVSNLATSAVGGIAAMGQHLINESMPIPKWDQETRTMTGGEQQKIPPEKIVEGYQGMAYQPGQEGRDVMGSYATDPAFKFVKDAVDKVRMGDETLEAGGGAALATANEIWPEIVSSIAGVKGIPQSKGLPPVKSNPLTGEIKPNMGKKALTADKIRNRPDASTATKKIVGGKVVTDKVAKLAETQGFGDDFIHMTRSANKAEKSNMGRMLDILEKRLADRGFDENPTAIIGDSFMQRINRLRQVKDKSGKRLDKVATGELRGAKVDVSNPVGEFNRLVFELGGALNDKGKLSFGVDSQLYKMGGAKSTLTAIWEKVNALGPNPDAYAVHKLKQYIYRKVKYGKTTRKGADGEVDAYLKGLAAKLDETLDGMSEQYDKVNSAYSSSTKALDEFQSAAGPTLNLDSPLADAAVGRRMRNILGKAANRENLRDAIRVVEDTARHYGGKYSDNMPIQMEFANELEKVFGPHAMNTSTSLAGNLDNMGQRLAVNPSIRQVGTEIAQMTTDQIKKMRVTQQKQLSALRALIRSE